MSVPKSVAKAFTGFPTDAFVINNIASGGAVNLLSDSVDLTHACPIIVCDSSCTLYVTTLDGTSLALPFFKGDNYLWVTRVWLTGTSLNGANVYGKYI